MELSRLPNAFTQIIYLTISPEHKLTDTQLDAGRRWSDALAIFENSPDYQSLRWARSVEQPAKVQLHVTRSSLKSHQDYVASDSYQTFLSKIQPLLDSSSPAPRTRHVTPMTVYTSSPTTPFHAPVTGTAIYLNTTSAWHEGSWPCWTHIVRHIPGCTGIAGGRVLEYINTGDTAAFAGISARDAPTGARIQNAFLVYVGWQSIKHHNDYHHTKHFADHGVVLKIGNEGWREYGHVRFEGWRGTPSTETENFSKL